MKLKLTHVSTGKLQQENYNSYRVIWESCVELEFWIISTHFFSLFLLDLEQLFELSGNISRTANNGIGDFCKYACFQ